jgi:hypothetical protein
VSAPTTRPPLPRTSAVVGAVGLALWLIGLLIDPRQALFSWLFAFAAVLTIAWGGLALWLIGYLTRLRTLLVVRPVARSFAAALPAAALLVLPVVIGMATLYPWVPPVEGFSGTELERLAAKEAYLNPTFFLARAILYVVVWTALVVLLRRAEASARAERRPTGVAAIGLIALAFTDSFAAIDWLMSLTPLWLSTVYPLYVLVGGVAAALALAMVRLRKAEVGRIDDRRGNLLLTLVLGWAYLGYSQYLIIWIGDLPAEVPFYLTRTRGSWGALSILLVAGHFVLPFLLLLFRRISRSRAALAAVGAWLVFMHFVDVYWLVLPVAHPDGLRLHWLDIAAVLAVTGLATAASVLVRRTLLRRGELFGSHAS